MKPWLEGPKLMLFTAGVGLGCALLMVFLLTSLAAPDRFGDRLAKVSDSLARSASLTKTAARRSTYPADAVCAGDATREAVRFSDDLASSAQAAGLSLSAVDVSPEPDPGAADRLVPVRVRFQATGSYEGAATLLDGLAQRRPLVFADTVDLTSNTSSVTLVFSGRAFCAS